MTPIKYVEPAIKQRHPFPFQLTYYFHIITKKYLQLFLPCNTTMILQIHNFFHVTK